jgi:hypothetical protein
LSKEYQSLRWAMATLRTEQNEYAALDAIKSLAIYDALVDLPDLTIHLIFDESSVHLQQSMTMVPKRGNLTPSSAHGTIVTKTLGGFSLHPPAGIEYQGTGNDSFLFEISEVKVYKILVLNTRSSILKRSGRLFEFGTSPFCLHLPI